MTQKERIEKLEREVSDLRLLVEAYRAMQPFAQPLAPFVPYTPPPAAPWPITYRPPSIYTNTANPPRPQPMNLSLVV